METLSYELEKIERLHKSNIWKALENLESLGESAANTGDPCLILSFCHEFFVLANQVPNLESASDAIRLYNSGMNVDYAEYYMSWTYRLLKKWKSILADDIIVSF